MPIANNRNEWDQFLWGQKKDGTSARPERVDNLFGTGWGKAAPRLIEDPNSPVHFDDLSGGRGPQALPQHFAGRANHLPIVKGYKDDNPRHKFATGGAFTVKGGGGWDNNVVNFRASDGERVTIETPEQQKNGGVTLSDSVSDLRKMFSDFGTQAARDFATRFKAEMAHQSLMNFGSVNPGSLFGGDGAYGGGAGFGGVSERHGAASIRYGRQHSAGGFGGDVGGRATFMDGGMATRARAAMTKLESLGWTHEAAAAAIGNAQQESGVRSDGPLGDTKRFGFGDDAAHGMFQWRGSRFRALRAFAAQKGTSWQNFNTQVEFFDQESKRYGSAEWRQTHDILRANQGMQRFEGYGDRSFGTRLANARQLAAGRTDGGFYGATQGGGGLAAKGDAAGMALAMQGAGEGLAARSLNHVMHAGEWCADFMNGIIQKSGGQGSGSAMASSFAQWGKAVSTNDAKRGDVILENSGPGTRIHHVGMATGNVQRDRNGNVTAVEMISGNYGHQVRKNWERTSIIAGMRRGNTGTLEAAPVPAGTAAVGNYYDKHAQQKPKGASPQVSNTTHAPITINPQAHHDPKQIAREVVAHLDQRDKSADLRSSMIDWHTG